MSQTCLIIPCYNEAQRLPTAEIESFLQLGLPVRICFVNDGSTDRTLELLRRFVASHPGQSELVHLEKNRGKAEAVRAGILHALLDANNALVGYWDADLATPLSELESFLALFAQRPELEIVLGSRIKHLGCTIERELLRHYLGRIFATANSLLLGIPVYDTQCGAKLFKAEVARQAFAEPFSSSWFFDVEVFARRICSHGHAHCVRTSYEWPLRKWEDKSGSKLKLLDFLRAPLELWRIQRRYGQGMRAWRARATNET